MIPLKQFGAGDDLRSYLLMLFRAIAELQNDAIDDVKSPLRKIGSSLMLASADTFSIQNNSGSDRARFEILGIDGVVNAPSADLEVFQQAPLLDGVTPTDAHVGYFAILLEDCAAGEIASCCMSGLAITQVNMAAEDDEYADVTDGDASQLTSDSSGAAQIIAVESGLGTQWAVVRLANTGSAGDASLPTGSANMVLTLRSLGGKLTWIADWARMHS